MDAERFESPFGWRYGSETMRALWSEPTKRRLMRRVWLALAAAERDAGLVSEEQLADLERTAQAIDIERAHEIEATTRHDVMAELLAWAEQAPVGGPILHLGATSADVTDNVDLLRVRDGLGLLREALGATILAFARRVDETADLPTLGWTHLQPAAPTTVGYRLAATLQDLVDDLREIDGLVGSLRSKGFKGAVGTGASYAALLEGHSTTAAELEAMAMARLGLTPAPVTTQVYARKTDWRVLNALAGIAASASTFAFHVRLMQSPPFGEWSEGFAEGQVGSSAMPWKRNPVNAETVNSLARFVAALPAVAWGNATLSLLERTLDDSANRRVVLPEAFLAVDEILRRTRELIERLAIEPEAVRATLARYGPFAATERVLLAAAAAGGDRQALHERLRRHSMRAWPAVERGEPNPLADALAADPDLTRYVDSGTIRRLLGQPEAHVGDAPARARAMASLARLAVSREAANAAVDTAGAPEPPM